MLVLGDDVTPVFGQQEKLVPSMSLVVGGSASITAVAAARLGLSVALVAAVGDDPAGQFMLDQMAREGVGADAVAVREDTPTGMTVALSSGGDRAILTALGAVGSLTAGDVPAALLAPGPARAHQLLLPARGLPRARPGRRHGDRAGGRGDRVAGHQLGSVRAVGRRRRLAAALAQVDLLLPNEAEAVRLSGAA